MNSKNNFKGFGDSLINFLYSLAKSKATHIWTGEKVSNYVLSQALIFSTLHQPGGLDKHEKGDFVEGYIAQAYIEGTITLDKATAILVSTLSTYDLEEQEEEAMIAAFTALLDVIEPRL
jgi:hypothetical protein